MAIQMRAQAVHVPIVEQVYGPAEYGVVDSFMMGTVQVLARRFRDERSRSFA